MDYGLTKELEDAGFHWNDDLPNLSELIEACDSESKKIRYANIR